MERTGASRPGKTSKSKEIKPRSPRSRPAPQVAQPDPVVTHAEIALLAHSFWEARGCQGGSPEHDWLRAEQELKARRASQAPQRVLKEKKPLTFSHKSVGKFLSR